MKFQAEEMIGIICRFQEIKKKRSSNKGVNTDPENLFCEEVKAWCVQNLCIRPIDEDAKGVLYKRIRYFEEILCANDLFDRPSSRVTHTVQQVIVACRGVLKYHTMPVIDKELAHHDARKAFDKLKQHFVTIIADTVELLFNVFRENPKKKGTQDTALKLLSLILEDPNIEEAFPDAQKEVRAKVLGQPEDWDNQRVKQKDFLKLGPENTIFLTESVILDEKQAGGIPLATNKEPIKDANLARLFVGDNCGFEQRFRGNHFVARQFLRCHALVFEMGSFFVVLQKAAACASQGGTLLVYGLANAQLNAMLDTAEKLLQSLRDSLNLLASISEIRFEELVYANEATVSRSPWIGHFKVVHSTLAKIDEMIKKVSGEISSMKIHANSMTLYDQFQKAQDDTTAFLSLADGFSKNVSGILGIAYSKPKSPPIVNLPSPKALDQLSEREVGPGSDGLVNVMDLSKCVTVDYSNSK